MVEQILCLRKRGQSNEKKFLSFLLVFCMFSFAFLLPVNASSDNFSVDEEHDKQIVEMLKAEMLQANGVARRSQTDEIDANEAQNLYDDYINYCTTKDVEPFADNTLEEFSEIAAENYSIAPRSASIAVLRLEGKNVANSMTALGYLMTGETLKHALQDNPPDLTWNAGNKYSNIVKSTTAYASLMNSIITQLHSTTGNYWSDDGHYSLGELTGHISNPDVLLSLHNVDYIAGAEKVNGKWDVYIRFFDTYDFGGIRQFDNPVLQWANDVGEDLEEMGVVVPYDIICYTKSTVQ